MTRRILIQVARWSLLLALLGACAPDNLDVTPSPTPTNTPVPTNTRAPTMTPEPGVTPAAAAAEATPEVAAVSGNQALLDHLLANLPATMPGGAFQWRARKHTNEGVQGMENTPGTPYPIYQEVEGGVTGKQGYREPGGSLAEITFGVFDTPEAAQAHYDLVLGRTRNLERPEERENFPKPNAFGGGTYGSDSIFLVDNLFIQVSVPQFSSTSPGEPLGPLARQVFTALDAARASYEQ
jgi:hypothetical protein